MKRHVFLPYRNLRNFIASDICSVCIQWEREMGEAARFFCVVFIMVYEEYLSCRLCPRECRANRNAKQKGFCGHTNLIKAGRAALHFWEEPCICDENGSGAVFFSGCSLRCTYCQNFNLSRGKQGRI